MPIRITLFQDNSSLEALAANQTKERESEKLLN